jgi:hypothetical protein
MIYKVESTTYQSYLHNGGSGKMSAKEHALQNMAAGSFCG